jgi:hypothetical protein
MSDSVHRIWLCALCLKSHLNNYVRKNEHFQQYGFTDIFVMLEVTDFQVLSLF